MKPNHPSIWRKSKRNYNRNNQPNKHRKMKENLMEIHITIHQKNKGATEPTKMKSKTNKDRENGREQIKSAQTLQGLPLITIYPFLRIVPACCGKVFDAPASAFDSKWCSSSDMPPIPKSTALQRSNSGNKKSEPRNRKLPRIEGSTKT